MSHDRRPRLGLVMGDPTGIGPEVLTKVLADPETFARCRPVVIGDARVMARTLTLTGAPLSLQPVTSVAACRFAPGAMELLDLANCDPAAIPIGAMAPGAAKAAGEALEVAVRLARQGELDGVVFAPLNKAALREAGYPFPDEHHLFASWTGATQFGEINVLDDLWTARATSHIALREVPAHLTIPAILKAARLLHTTMIRAGQSRLRIGVAALNPHGGEGGLFGAEEREVIAPAVRQAQGEGIDARGPFPADTVFVRARRGELDGVVSMYHDQGQIATKLLGFDRGVTVSGGLPIVVTTPAHGTAYEIAGQGVADPGAFAHAVVVAARLARGRP
jgi:4-hydroxythreonine-4-phosphate dehydrogenase